MSIYNDIIILINNKLGDASDIKASEHREVEIAMLNYVSSSFLPGDIKEIDCTEAYIAANFDGTGLGINERVGWAICNGNNGTRNRGGRVSVARGGAFTSVGTTMNSPVTGGSANSVVVSHTHPYRDRYYIESAGSTVNQTYKELTPTNYNNNRGSGDSDNDNNYWLYYDTTTSSSGESGTDKNYQPYIVSLHIMKL